MKKIAAVTVTLVMVLSLIFGVFSGFADEAAVPENEAETISDEVIISEPVGAAPVEAVSELKTQVADTGEVLVSESAIPEEIPQADAVSEPSESMDTNLDEIISNEPEETADDGIEIISEISESAEEPASETFEETNETEEAAEPEISEDSDITAEADEPEDSDITLEADEPEDSDITLEADEPEDSDITVEADDPEESEESEDAPLDLAASFTDGGTYVITIKNSDTTYAITNNNGTITAEPLASVDAAEDSMKWTASGSSKAGLANGGKYLYYDKSALAVNTTSDKKTNWTLSGTSLFYSAGGDKYYISGVSGSTVTLSKSSSDAAVVELKGVSGTEDPDTSQDSSSGGDDSGEGGGSSSSSTYNEVDPKAGITTTYIELVDANKGLALSLDMGSFFTSTVTVAGDKGSRTSTVSKGVYIKATPVGDGFTFMMQDPPDEWNYIYIADGALTALEKGTSASADPTLYNKWHLSGKGYLYYNDNGTRYYLGADGTVSTSEIKGMVVFGGDTASGGGGGGGGKKSEIVETDAKAPAIIEQPEATPYMTEGSGYAAPVYTITAALPADSKATSIVFTWYVNGEAQPANSVSAAAGENITNTITAVSLADKSFGVYPVYCVVSCDLTDEAKTVTTYSNTSVTVNFIVCKGINNSQFFTYSDVHETFSHIGYAINNIMTGSEGLIPALMICTGDWANSHYLGGEAGTDNYNTTMNTFISRLAGQAGGIDTVYVAGNHDNTAAARAKNLEVNLGAKEENAESGVIFDSKVAAENGTSSKDMENLLVYGIDFENIKTDSGYSYERVLPDLERFLEETRADYAGQLIVISAHAGLHKLDDWGGKAEYNVDQSSEMVKLINKYAATGMNIMFFFGHDHSKGESELIKVPGETLTSTVSYNDQTTEDIEILFTYGHAGYITTNSGGNKRYTVTAYTDLSEHDATVTREMYTLDSNFKAEKNEDLTKTIDVAGEDYLLTDYQITEGAESEWTTGDDGIAMHANGSLDVFSKILVDGNEVDEKYYTAAAGSTIVTLKPEYLGTLANGSHDLTIQFSNGETSAPFSVEIIYQIIEGADSEWKTGDSGVTMSANGVLEAFIGISIDGTPIAGNNYTTTGDTGSTTVTLSPAYLNTLENGTHTLTMHYTNGDTSADFSVEIIEPTPEPKPQPDPDIRPADSGNRPGGNAPSDSKSVPKTGDESNVLMWILLIAASFALITSASAIAIRRK